MASPNDSTQQRRIGTLNLEDSDSGRRSANQQPLVTVVIPALNEASNLPHVLPRIPSWVHEVLLVDGNSTDNTVEVAHRLVPEIQIIYQGVRGKGAALRAGFQAATGDIVITLDADGSMDPGEIPAFVGALLAGADYVKGSRFLQGGGTADMGAFRKLGNAALKLIVRFLFGAKFSDLCYGYNAFWRDILPRLRLDADGFEIEALMHVRAVLSGLHIAEVPSFEARRLYGESHLRAIPDGWRVLKTIMSARFDRRNRRVDREFRIDDSRSQSRPLAAPPYGVPLETESTQCPTCGR